MRRSIAAVALPAIALVLGSLAGTSAAPDGTWELRMCADPLSLPFSSEDGAGFESRIAEVLADELHARVTYDWHLFNADLINERLREGECDLIMGVPDGYKNLLTTVAYYQSPFVFIYRADSPFHVESLDDPVLRTLRIGVQSAGIPPYEALFRRGLAKNVVAKFGMQVGTPDHLAEVVRAVARGDIDVGLAWGPVAGFFAERAGVKLNIVPVTPRFDPPSSLMSIPMTIGVRQGDESLRDRLNVAIAERWDDIQAVLKEYGVPLDPLPGPVVTREDLKVVPSGSILRVGVVIPTQTGSSYVHASLYDIVGEAARMGALLAEEDLAPQPESGGPEVRVLMASAPSAAAAVRAVERLRLTEDVQALVGGLGEGEAGVLAALAELHHVPFLNIGSPHIALGQACNRHVFHVEASGGMYLDAWMDWFSTQGNKRWFIVYEDSDEGRALRARALEAVARHQPQGEVVGSVAVSVEQPTYIPELQAIKDAAADGVLLLVDAADQMAFLSQLASAGLDVDVAPFPHPVTQTRDFLAAARFRYDAAALGERVALWETTLATPGAAELNERYTARWGKPMDPPAWAAYQSVRMLYQAAAATGALDAASLIGYLENPATTFETGKGPGVSFRPWDHQLRQPLYLVRVDPGAEWGITMSKQVGVAALVAKVPADDAPLGNAIQRLDRLGDGPEAAGCHFGS